MEGHSVVVGTAGCGRRRAAVALRAAGAPVTSAPAPAATRVRTRTPLAPGSRAVTSRSIHGPGLVDIIEYVHQAL